jgi:DNA-binding CsgD family transcriptional regulator
LRAPLSRWQATATSISSRQAQLAPRLLGSVAARARPTHAARFDADEASSGSRSSTHGALIDQDGSIWNHVANEISAADIAPATRRRVTSRGGPRATARVETVGRSPRGGERDHAPARGARRESRAPLRAGHELALACHAHAVAVHARNELAASGVNVERGDLARRDELTPSERRIANMPAEGAPNKPIAQSLFLTVKTVEMHLSSAYRKLDIRSRRDLASALAASAGEPTA